MNRHPVRRWLLAAGIGLALPAAALGHDAPAHATVPVSRHTPPYVTPLELAHLLTVAAPEQMVVTFDQAPHAMRGAMPATLFGATDDDVIANLPIGVQLVLVCSDEVRLDCVARRLMVMGRSVRVLRGGVGAWEAALARQLPTPSPAEGAERWARYRYEVALRHAFGEVSAAPTTTPIAAPVRPAAAPAGGSGGRREGC